MNSGTERLATEKWAAQLRKGTLELAILACLWEEPRYGLEIIRALDDAGLGIGEGTLYPILNRLRGEDILSSEWRQEGTGNPRKYYTLTPLGRNRTQCIAKEWQSFTEIVQQILRKISRTRSPS